MRQLGCLTSYNRVINDWDHTNFVKSVISDGLTMFTGLCSSLTDQLGLSSLYNRFSRSNSTDGTSATGMCPRSWKMIAMPPFNQVIYRDVDMYEMDV